MIGKNTIFVLAVATSVLCAEPVDQPLDKEVRSFVQKAVDGEGIIDYYNRQKSDKILKNPRDWEAVLSQMLDVEAYSERELEIVIHIIEYRGTSDDSRVNDSLRSYFNQLVRKARDAKINNLDSEKVEREMRYLSTQATNLARLYDPDILTELLEYTVSAQEDDLLAIYDATYANIFLGTKGVETARHGDLIERLLPKLRQRGLKEKTIALGEETLERIRGIHPRKVGNKIRNGRSDSAENSRVITPSDRGASEPSVEAALSESSGSKWYYALLVAISLGGIFLWLKLRARA